MTTAVTPIPRTSTGANALLGDSALRRQRVSTSQRSLSSCSIHGSPHRHCSETETGSPGGGARCAAAQNRGRTWPFEGRG